MDAWWQCEVPYPFVPQEVLNATDSVRASLPNRYCDPKVAADLFEEVIDEFLLCDDLGLNVLAVEEYATADVISRGRLEIGFVKSGGTEMASNNANPVNNIERYWEAIDLITKALTHQEGPFTWE